jgi:hypothetical protein
LPTRAFGQHYGVGQVKFFLELVLVGGTSLRAAGRLFPLIGASLQVGLGEPDWTTGRWWLLRLGLAKLLEPKEQAADWVWLIDHSAQIGQEKCLLILGVRAANLPPPGRCLRHEDVQVIHLRVLKDPSKHTVYQELETAAQQTGIPRAIVDDHGADIHGGVKLFQEQHAQTTEIYDITHKGACLLKHRLEKDERWSHFTRQVGQTKTALLQTELACLVPPHQRTKSRYMNLDTVLEWGTKTLALVEQPPAELLAKTTRERLQHKLGWLKDYREAMAEWSEWHGVVTAAESQIRRMGLYVGIAQELAAEWKALAHRSSTRELAQELEAFVASQASPLQPDERLPGSTEVLESCFGKLKVIEKDQARNGFTAMVLSLAAMVWKTTAAVVHRALETCSIQMVKEWIEDNLGKTVQAQRRQAYQSLG